MDAIEKALRMLGLSPGATPEDINQAYRDLAMVWHPDRFPNDSRVRQKAEEKLKEINGAYRILKNCGHANKRGTRDDRGVQSEHSSDHDRPESPRNNAPSSGESSATEPAAPERSSSWFRVPYWAYVVGPIIVVILIIYILEKSTKTKRFDTPNVTNAPTLRVSSQPTSLSSASAEVTAPDTRWVDELWGTVSPEQPRNVALDTFSVGSTKDDVLRLQGTPTNIANYPALGHEVWHYGISSVEISTKTGRVTQWSNSGNLQVSLKPGGNVTTAKYFTQGSHKDEVLRLQGTPTNIANYPALGHEVWHYGISSVEISTKTGRVTQWRNSGNLKVSLKPGGNVVTEDRNTGQK